MNEASRVQKLLIEQNDEINRLKNQIERLEAANLKQSLIKVDDMTRIIALEAALEEALEFVENYEDVVDGGDGIPAPNRAMNVAMTIRGVLEDAKWTTKK